MRTLIALYVLLVGSCTGGCFGTWDTVKTQPSYAPQPAYVHYPAPYSPIPASSRGP